MEGRPYLLSLCSWRSQLLLGQSAWTSRIANRKGAAHLHPLVLTWLLLSEQVTTNTICCCALSWPTCSSNCCQLSARQKTRWWQPNQPGQRSSHITILWLISCYKAAQTRKRLVGLQRSNLLLSTPTSKNSIATNSAYLSYNIFSKK